MNDKDFIDRLTIKLSRTTIQGGLKNEEFDSHNLTDWRLQHHIATDYIKLWKNYGKVSDDSKFTDIQSINDPNLKAEGKKMTDGVSLCPSRDTGANRSFSEENLQKCLEINDHYYLYDRGEITDTTIEFIIYWIPINLIKLWYLKRGNKKGKITGKNIQICIENCIINDTKWDRTNH